MRLIIFVKIPERVDPIPLDIIDDRPSQAVLEDILVLGKLAIKNNPISKHYLSRNGTKLDLSLELSQNGVQNGMLLDLIKTNENIIPVKKSQFKEEVYQETPSDIIEEPISIKRTQKKVEPSNVPGKKIDFD